MVVVNPRRALYTGIAVAIGIGMVIEKREEMNRERKKRIELWLALFTFWNRSTG